MSRITIVSGLAGDDTVVKNGRALHFPVEALLPNSSIWAVQWYGTEGEIEYTDRNPESFTDISLFDDVLDEFIRLAALEDALAVPTLSEAKATKRLEINNAADEALSVVTSQYPNSEIDSWPVQIAEAEKWVEDELTPTPFIDGLLARRPGITKADMASRIMGNAVVYKALSSDVTGQRQYLDGLVDLATTKDEVQEVVVDITLPVP